MLLPGGRADAPVVALQDVMGRAAALQDAGNLSSICAYCSRMKRGLSLHALLCLSVPPTFHVSAGLFAWPSTYLHLIVSYVMIIAPFKAFYMLLAAAKATTSLHWVTLSPEYAKLALACSVIAAVVFL